MDLMGTRRLLVETIGRRLLGAFLGLLALLYPGHEGLASPEVRAGSLDLRELSRWSGDTIRLQGDWCFVPGRFVGAEIRTDVMNGCALKQAVPRSWGRDDNLEGVKDGRGFGSYAMIVHLDGSQQTGQLAIRWERAFSALSAFIYGPSGELLVDPVYQGRPGIDLESSIPVLTNHVVPFSARGIDNFLVVLHISNFRYFSGGIWFTPSLSSAETAQQTHLSGLLLDMVVFGILVVVALYHVILYAQRREDRTPLYFALFCSGIALRLGIMAHFVESLGFARTPEGFEVLMTLEYITAPLAIIGAGLFLSEMMPSAWFKNLVNGWFLGGGLLLIAYTFIAPVLTFSSLTWIYEVHVAGAALGGMLHLAQQVREKNRVARWVMVAFVVLVIGTVNDIAHIEGLVKTAHVAPYCFVVFVLIQSAILAQNFAQTVEEKTSLSQRVLEQTARLAEETQLRADAEHELRLELEAKVMLLGDAVHHLNNPLNHIQGVSRTLAECHRELMSQFESMLPPESERDSMADTIISQFKERFSELDQSTGILSSAVGRASDTVTSLRVLSGVDGVSYEPTDFETIWEGFRRRSPQLAMSYNVAFGDSDTVQRCHGSSVTYAIAIELVLSKAEALDLDVDSVSLIPLDSCNDGDPEFWALQFVFDKPIDAALWSRTCTAVGYLLRPYWCEAGIEGSVLSVEVLRKMPSLLS